ncbi:MAG TPA: hypothetical protein VFQ20_07355 [Burkholderiaceae bacterium]|nr:hypothetical protein [Burkholderiaceae bacterium]
MPPLSNARRPIGRQSATPARGRKPLNRHTGTALALPHERDESPGAVSPEVDPLIAQAQRDLDAGLVDTDMRSTPGLDAQRRAKLVPGPAGRPPTLADQKSDFTAEGAPPPGQRAPRKR